MIYIITILPIIFYVLIIKAMDGFSIASWKRVSGWFTWGLFCCGILFSLSGKITWNMVWGSCFWEELLKCLPLIIAINRKSSTRKPQTNGLWRNCSETIIRSSAPKSD